MTSILILLYIVAVVISILIGYFFGRALRKIPTSGNLLSAYDPVDGLYLFLELEQEPKDILKHDYVIFRVRKSSKPYNDRIDPDYTKGDK